MFALLLEYLPPAKKHLFSRSPYHGDVVTMAETVVDVGPETVDLAPEPVLAEEEVAIIDLPDAMPSVEDESVGPDNITGYK